MSVFAPSSPCCRAPIDTRTDGPGGIGRTLQVCSKCDMVIPGARAAPKSIREPMTVMNEVVERIPWTEDAPSSPARRPAAPRPPRAAAPTSLEPTMATPTTRRATECGHPVSPKGPIPKTCAACRGKRSAKAPPRADKPRPRIDTGFKGAPPMSRDNAYQPTIDALRQELDGLEARRQGLSDAIAHLEKLGAA
jgi:hypothetical protein